MRRITFVFLFLSLSLWAKITVAVSLEPQAWLVDQIGGDKTEVVVMVPPGASAHLYEPKPAQMVQLSKAALYMACGVEFERIWLERFKSANAGLAIIQSDALIRKLPMPVHHHNHHEAHEKGLAEHLRDWFGANDAHADRLDSHIWLSAQQMALQARALARALARADSQNADFYWRNYQKTATQIARLDAEIAMKLAPFEGRGFMVFHPAWGYFARDYDLVQLAIELEGKEPKPAELGKLIQTAKEHGVRAIFVQPRQSNKSAAAIAEAIGAQTVALDPLSRDWPAMMQEAAEKLAGAMVDTGR